MKNVLYIIPLAFLISCSGEKVDNTDNEELQEAKTSIESIEFSKKQIDLAGIKTGKFEKKTISETIECSGTIEVPPQNIATVSPVISGFIKNLNYYPGDNVEKGSVLGTLNHPDFITLQQQYIEAKSQVDFYQEEYKRQGELTVENAASIKKMQKAKADYLTYEANYKSLKAQLELLGVNTSEIEKGEFVKDFKISAPISGTISQLSANKGKFVSSEDFVYEIINASVLNIKLNVFEKDLSKVKIGQTIRFSILNNETQFVSKVKRVGIKIDKSNRTSLVQSAIDNKNQLLKPGMYVNASININEKEAFTLPYEAVVDLKGESFVFIKKDNSFKRIKIEKGVVQDDFCEILNLDKELLKAEVVIKGVYYLIAKTETEE